MDKDEILTRLNAGADPLELEIEHWTLIGLGKDQNHDELNSPLCAIYHNKVPVDANYRKNACVGCPVFAKTGKQFCEGTPYEKYIDIEIFGTDEEKTKYVNEEIEFLKGLRIHHCLNCNRKTIRPGDDVCALPHCACVTTGSYLSREKLLFCVDALSQQEINHKLRNLNVGCIGWQETPIPY
ncbi:Uncharacterised protein [uncultured archaeon]|nr:Uncharacterised protein [uncultured archaeon]